MNVPNQALRQPVIPNNALPEAHCTLGNLFLGLPAISLGETNATARMLSRIDNKYLLDFDQFADFLDAVSPSYSVLEIDQRRQFTYKSCYYDQDYCCYFEHHQGRRQRLKVRTREYVDGGGMKYLEIKLKGARGLTVKHRSEVDTLITPRIKGEQLSMLQDLYARQYNKQMRLDLKPALLVGYKRCTLVAREGGERVTVDYGLSFGKPEMERTGVQLGSDFIVVETKSAKGTGTADKALRGLKIRQVSRCSKYCIGVNLTGSVTRNNNFLGTIRRARKNITAEQRPAQPTARSRTALCSV